jgi:hypothetical protein
MGKRFGSLTCETGSYKLFHKSLQVSDCAIHTRIGQVDELDSNSRAPWGTWLGSGILLQLTNEQDLLGKFVQASMHKKLAMGHQMGRALTAKGPAGCSQALRRATQSGKAAPMRWEAAPGVANYLKQHPHAHRRARRAAPRRAPATHFF